MPRALLALFQVLVLALPAWAQDSDSTFIQRQIDLVEDEIAADLRQVDTARRQARQYGELAESAEKNAAESQQPQDRQSWLDSARQRRDRAAQLEQEAAKLQERVAEKEANLNRLKEQLAERRQARERRQAGDRKFEEQQKQKAVAEAAAEPLPRMPVDQVLGLWGDPEGEPLAIVQQDPGNAAYPHRLEAHSPRREWTGNYHSEGSKEPMVTLSYKPTAEEINPEVPEWARARLAGQLEWKLEIEPGGTCGTPSLKATFYPGEIKWREDGEDAPDGAWIAGKGKAREIALTAEQPDAAFYTYGAPILYLRAPGDFDRNLDTIDGLIEAQLFHVDVILPPELADKEGETLDVAVKGLSGAGNDTVVLRRGAVRVGRSVIYTHYDPIAIAVPSDLSLKNLRPSFLSVDYFLNLTGNRLDLDPSNAELIEFSHGGAVQTVPIYKSWVQRGIARHQEALQRLRPFFAAVVNDASSTREQKEAATKRLNMIRNYERIFESEKVHDYVRYQLGEHYLRPFGGLVMRTDAEIAATAELAHTWVGAGRLDTPLTDRERDGGANPSGFFENVAWTSRYEMATTQAIVVNARKDYQDIAVSELSKATLFAMYSGVASLSGAGDAVVLFTGTDIFGRRVAQWERVMAAVGMASSNLMQVTLPRVASVPNFVSVFRPANTGGRVFRPGPRTRLKKVETPASTPAGRTEQVEAALARLTPAQRNSVAPAASAGEPALNSNKPVACARRNPRAPAADLPGPIGEPPPRPGPIDNDAPRVAAFYGKNAKVVDPGAAPLVEPQQYSSCQCSSIMLRLKEITGRTFTEMEVLHILRRNGAVNPSVDDPLVKGYNDEQLMRLLEVVGAEVLPVPAAHRLSLENLDAWIQRGWHVRDVVNTLNTKEPHAIELRKLTRNPKGEITDVEWFDPAFGKRIETKGCDYVNDLVAPGYDTIMYRWKEGGPNFEGLDTSAPAARPNEPSPQTPVVEFLESSPVLTQETSPPPVAPRDPGPQTSADAPPDAGTTTPRETRKQISADDADGQQSVADAAPPTRPNPGAKRDTRVLMNEVIDEMYPAGDMPPLHVTDQASLQKIIESGIWEQPAGGGASFSQPGIGTLRMGDVAIRVKPGHEGFVEMRPHPMGRVPMFWRSGKKDVGESHTYIPTEHLEWLNPVARAWRPFPPKGR